MNTPAASRAATDPAFEEASSLAKWLFKTHYAQDPDYASGKVTWELCGSTAGIISQIDNMVSGLVRPAAQPASPAPLTDNGNGSFTAWSVQFFKDNGRSATSREAWRGAWCERAALASPQVAPADVVSDALDAFERRERGSVQAHVAAKLVAELRAALAAPVQVAPSAAVITADEINGKPPTAQSILEAMVDIQEDYERNAPEHRCYADSAQREIFEMARRFVAATAPVAPQDDARDAAEEQGL